LNGQSIHVSDGIETPRQIIGVTINKSGFVDTSRVATDLIGRRYKILDLGSIVYHGMLVASGQLAGVIFPYDSAHDIAAIKILIEEAGGRTSDIFGNPQKYDTEIKGFVGSNGRLHDELLGIIKDTL